MNKTAIILTYILFSASSILAQEPSSLVDYLKSQGRESGYTARRETFSKLYPGERYLGTADQNSRMLGTLRFGNAMVEHGEPDFGLFRSQNDGPLKDYCGRPNNPILFKPNGCGSLNGINVPDFDFGTCCDTHDWDYTIGGNSDDRLRADKRLMKCIEGKGHNLLARAYFLGVRAFGGQHFNWKKPAEDFGPPSQDAFDSHFSDLFDF